MEGGSASDFFPPARGRRPPVVTPPVVTRGAGPAYAPSGLAAGTVPATARDVRPGPLPALVRGGRGRW